MLKVPENKAMATVPAELATQLEQAATRWAEQAKNLRSRATEVRSEAVDEAAKTLMSISPEKRESHRAMIATVWNTADRQAFELEVRAVALEARAKAALDDHTYLDTGEHDWATRSLRQAAFLAGVLVYGPEPPIIGMLPDVPESWYGMVECRAEELASSTSST
jgi:hypothetical protein